jgi:molybdenum cofactor synthesis domain-containing protein
MNLPCSVIVCSDRARAGTYEDRSGPAARDWLESKGWTVTQVKVIPDDPKLLKSSVTEAAETSQLIVVSGGTGIGERDITPQTLAEFCDFEIPGVGEILRAESMKITPNGWLSRCGAWVFGRRLVVALPGSPKAVVEQLNILEPMIPKAMRALAGTCEHRP